MKAVGLSRYTTAFTTHGYVNYGSCINLSEEDLRAVGVKNDDHVRWLMNRAKELRNLSEEDAVKVLSVNTRNYSVLCVLREIAANRIEGCQRIATRNENLKIEATEGSD